MPRRPWPISRPRPWQQTCLDLDDMSVWLGLVAPKGTPKPIIDKIHAEVVKTLADPAIKEKSERTGNYPVT